VQNQGSFESEALDMARVNSVELPGVDIATLDQGAKVNIGVAGILAQRPLMAECLGAFSHAVIHSGTLPRRLVELIRLRIAFHNQCRSCMAIRYREALEDGVTDDLVCSLENPQEAPDLTPAERAVLRFADLFATNHFAIDDSVYDDLRQYYTEGELVEIGLNCALDVGIGRLAATWHVIDDLSDDIRNADGKVLTPWGQPQLIVS
jgi:AhpD family alkylhydroperoxidase